MSEVTSVFAVLHFYFCVAQRKDDINFLNAAGHLAYSRRED